MNCFVTGASGFIGSHLVGALLRRGHRVKGLVRPGSKPRGMPDLQFEQVTGNLEDRELLDGELAGCDWCFHVAASYHLWLRDYAPMRAANVEGTRNILEAAGRGGCRKIVHTSTVGCIGLPSHANGKIIPATEADTLPPSELVNNYKRSKFEAEAVALELHARKGLPVVIVNPSAPVGPGDGRPTPTGQIIVDFLNRRLPAYLDTGLNWVHVRDVAEGMVLAAEKGAPGERYILGHAQGNWTLQQTFATLEKISGIPAPRVKMPYWLALRVAEISEGVAWFTGRAPRATLGGVRMARHKMWYNPAKAIRDLGLPQTPLEQAFTEAIAWFQSNGYAKTPGLNSAFAANKSVQP